MTGYRQRTGTDGLAEGETAVIGSVKVGRKSYSIVAIGGTSKLGKRDSYGTIPKNQTLKDALAVLGKTADDVR